jgi:hypothetical protein
LGAISLSTNPTEEKKNGQGSNKKQPREEETETGEGKTYGCCIAVFRQPAEAHDRLFIGQEAIARAAVGMAQRGILDHFAGPLSANHAENSLFNLHNCYKLFIINNLWEASDPLSHVYHIDTSQLNVDKIAKHRHIAPDLGERVKKTRIP